MTKYHYTILQLTFSCQCNMPIIARMNTQTPIRAMAVSNTMLLGVRYSLALQLWGRGEPEKVSVLSLTDPTAYSVEITEKRIMKKMQLDMRKMNCNL